MTTSYWLFARLQTPSENDIVIPVEKCINDWCKNTFSFDIHNLPTKKSRANLMIKFVRVRFICGSHHMAYIWGLIRIRFCGFQAVSGAVAIFKAVYHGARIWLPANWKTRQEIRQDFRQPVSTSGKYKVKMTTNVNQYQPVESQNGLDLPLIIRGS